METRETITVDARAQRRLYVLQHLDAGRLTADQAAGVLELSVRQVRRLLASYRAGGLAGLVHGNRGRAPTHRTPDELRERLVGLARTTYAGVNRAHLADLLAEREGLAIPERTLRRILDEEGVAKARGRRRARHRGRRERMAREGLLLQVDGSRHDWLEGRGPVLTLVGGIDDATSRVTGATFRLAEDAAGYFLMLTHTARRLGLPGALYSDRHGIFHRDRQRPPTLAEQLTGQRSLTQVGRALDELDIRWIGARSPQAKGRVERLWGTLQDRLISELRLAGAETLEQANVVLARYLPRHDRRFAVPAADPAPAWRAWPLTLPPEAVLCFHYPRRVANDATVGWAGGSLQLPRRRDGRSWAGRSVILQERLDGSLWVSHEAALYPVRPAPADPGQLRARDLSRLVGGQPDPDPGAPAGRSVRTSPRARPAPRPPSPDHPWRSPYSRPGR
jgi:transposase